MGAIDDSLALLSGLDVEDGAPLSRAERRDMQVARILDAAKACFVRSGFQGASMQQICAEAGMSPGALYRYFPSKEAIIEAITEKDRGSEAVIFDAMSANPSAFEGLVQAAMAHIRHMHQECKAPLFTEIRAESLRNPVIREACFCFTEEIAAKLGKHLECAARRGEIDPCVEPEALLPALVAIGEGFAMNDLPALGISWDRIETIIRSMLTGLLRPVPPAGPGGRREGA